MSVRTSDKAQSVARTLTAANFSFVVIAPLPSFAGLPSRWRDQA